MKSHLLGGEMENCINCGQPLVTVEFREEDNTWGTMRVCDECGYEEEEALRHKREEAEFIAQGRGGN